MNMMVPRTPKTTFKQISDLVTGFKLIFTKDKIVKNETLVVQPSESLNLNQEVGGSLIYRSWKRSNHFFKRVYGNAIEWHYERLKSLEQNNSTLQAHFEEIARVQANKAQAVLPSIGNNYKDVILSDMGHLNRVSGSEPFTGILLSEKLGYELLPTKMIAGQAVEFKAIQNNEEIFFEIKPGFSYLKSFKLEKVIHQLKDEQQKTGLNNIKLVLECSDMDYNDFQRYQEKLLQSKYSNDIILIHKDDSNIIQQIIENQTSNLHQVDTILYDIHNELSEKEFNILNANDPILDDKKYKGAYRSLEEIVDQRFYESPPKWNNGYETLEEGDLDNLYKE